jgi:hypothetical protein
MRFVEFSWLVISLASHMARNNHACGKKSATLNLILSGNRGAQASAQAERISRAQVRFQNLHGPAAGYLACFSLDPAEPKEGQHELRDSVVPQVFFRRPPLAGHVRDPSPREWIAR